MRKDGPNLTSNKYRQPDDFRRRLIWIQNRAQFAIMLQTNFQAGWHPLNNYKIIYAFIFKLFFSIFLIVLFNKLLSIKVECHYIPSLNISKKMKMTTKVRTKTMCQKWTMSRTRLRSALQSTATDLRLTTIVSCMFISHF